MIWIEFTPNEEGEGFEFENAIVGGVVPREFIPAVEKGLVEPMVTVFLQVTQWLTPKLSFTTVQYHDVDHSKLSSRLRLHSLKEAAKSAQPAILELMMLVTITVPEENLGDVIARNCSSTPIGMEPR